MTVKITKDSVYALMSNIRAMASKQVLVGVPEDKGARKSGDGISNAQIAYISENGSPLNNIPARPSIVPGIEEAQEDIVKLLGAGAARALNAPGEIDKALERAGLRAVSSIRAVITRNDFEPLKPGTLRARERRGFKGTKALIVTGQFRNSINYVVRKK